MTRNERLPVAGYYLLLLANLPALLLSGFQALAALAIGMGLTWLDLVIRPLLIVAFGAIASGLAMARAEYVVGNTAKACRMLAIQFAVSGAAYLAFFLYVTA